MLIGWWSWRGIKVNIMGSLTETLQQHKIPIIIPILFLASVTIAAFIAPIQILLAISIAELAYLAISIGGIGRFLHITISPLAVFVVPFLLLSTAIQILVGDIDTAILMVSTARVVVLYLTAVLSIRMLSIGRVIRDLSRFSPVMALYIAIGIRMLTLGLYILNEIKGVYSINIAPRCSSLRFRVSYTILLTKAITRIFILTVLDIGESIYSRYNRYIYGKPKVVVALSKYPHQK